CVSVAPGAARSAPRRRGSALRVRKSGEAQGRADLRLYCLLPSDPPQVGERLVHRQPPAPISAQRNENASGAEARSTARLELSAPLAKTCRDRASHPSFVPS